MDIDFNKVKQHKVRKFILKFGLDNLSGWAKFKAVCYNPTQDTSYRKHFQSFLIRKDVSTVWDIYRTIHPNEA